ncbi:protein FAM83E [Anolis carolinensis]|uniref:Scaffolding anchor of CK1 domain-containing protein n=1 Tax=Anolis carolinensis TaxID=28377 RepID=H9GSI7_ANOCA|nr:PREDICTED: protein FAM83E [Anolis carolinensis]|eukprot:XP_008115432.1 PREDICTED: protein FAM83E [Anolis carolinensis]
MAGSQVRCLESEAPYLKITESNPEFYYCEGQRLALEALLSEGEEAFKKSLIQEKLRPFLSDAELRELKAEVKEEDWQTSEPVELGKLNHDGDESSFTYWPGRSDEPTPELELGWPSNNVWKGITRAEVYTHPPGEGAPHIKELVRRSIQQADKVIAVVMDVFSDPDILLDLYDAAVRRRIPVYIILSRKHLLSFLIMAEKTCLNVRHTENLRVRFINGCTFQSRHENKEVTGIMKEKFVLVDGEVVITGSYSFTWTDARLNRQLVTRLTGEVTEAFDREFRTLYAASCPLPTLEVSPRSQPTSTTPLPTPNGPDAAPFISVLDGVQLSNRISERRSVAPQPVAKSRAGEWDLVLASPATAEDPMLPVASPEVSIRNRLAAWRGKDISGGGQQGTPEGHNALSDILRNVQRNRLSVAKTTGARPSKSLWDLSRLSGSSTTGWGWNGTDSPEDAKKWGYQDTPAKELMKQRGTGHTPDESRTPIYLAHGRMTTSPAYPALGRLQGQLYHHTAGTGLPRAWVHSGKPQYGHQIRF